MKWRILWNLLEAYGISINVKRRTRIQEDYEYVERTGDFRLDDEASVDLLTEELVEVTRHLYVIAWCAEVYHQYESSHHERAAQNALYAALGDRAEQALERGRQEFAAGFSDIRSREIFLHGTEEERGILVDEANMAYEKLMSDEANNSETRL